MCNRVVIKLSGYPGELKIIYVYYAKCKLAMLKEITSLDHGHLQVHSKLKPSNRVVNIYLYSLSLLLLLLLLLLQACGLHNHIQNQGI